MEESRQEFVAQRYRNGDGVRSKKRSLPLPWTFTGWRPETLCVVIVSAPNGTPPGVVVTARKLDHLRVRGTKNSVDVIFDYQNHRYIGAPCARPEVVPLGQSVTSQTAIDGLQDHRAPKAHIRGAGAVIEITVCDYAPFAERIACAPQAMSPNLLGGSSRVRCWYGRFPIALFIQVCGASWPPQASRARRQPRELGRFLVATPLKRASHCLRRPG
jgi:hypothetical protein